MSGLLLIYAGYDHANKTGIYRVRRSALWRPDPADDAIVRMRVVAHHPCARPTETRVTTLAFCQGCCSFDCVHAMFVQQRTRPRASR